MIVLIIWNVVLTAVIVFVGLMFLGARARDERDKVALVHDVNTEFDAAGKRMNLLSERIDKLLEVQRNFLAQVKTLEGVSEQIENLQAGFENLQETQKGLCQDVAVLLRADDEHPVTAVIGSTATKPNKGGRPKREQI